MATGTAPDAISGQKPGGPVGAALLLLGGIASFQVGGSLAKLVFVQFGPLGTVSLRLWLGAILLGALVRPWRAAPDRGTLLLVARYGASIAVMNMLFYLALARLPLGIAVAVEFLGPLILTFAESRRPVDLLLAALVLAGLGLLLQPGAALHDGGIDLLGVVFALLAGAAWAVYILVGARVSRRMDAPRATAIGLAVGALLATPVFVPTLPHVAAHPAAAALAGVVAVLSSALPYTLEMLAMKHLNARQYGILASLDPVMAALIGLVLLDERLAPSQWIGILCIVAASIGGVMVPRAARPAAATAGEP